MEHDPQGTQFCQTLIQQSACGVFKAGQRLLINFPEMAGIRQARAHDTLIACDHLFAAVRRLDIRDQQKVVRQRTGFRITHDKTFLVGADGRTHHLGRYFQKARIKRSHQHDRPFDKPCNFVQKPFVFYQFKTAGKRLITRFMQNRGFALFAIEDHMRLFQRCDIVVKTPHMKVRGCMKTMPPGLITRMHAIDFKFDDLRRLGV